MQKNRLPPELLRSVLEGRVLLFLGPQVTQAAGVDTLGRLRDAFALALRQRALNEEAREVEGFLARADLAELAQAARLDLGPEEYHQLVRAQLEAPEALPPRLLFALRALPVRRWLTTSVDSVIDRALAGFGEEEDGLRVIVPGPGVDDPMPPIEEGHVLVKLFGVAADPEGVVLTSDDYEGYFRRRPQLVERLHILLETETPLFIGFAPDDPDFRRIYAVVGARLAEHRRRAYALMTGVTRFDTQWWGRRGLRVVPFADLAAVEDAVRDLARHVRIHHAPGMPVEGERPPLARDGGADHSTPELDLVQAQLHWARTSWLYPAPQGADPLPAWVATPLSPESGRRASREDRLATLLADGQPDAPARLHAAAAVTVEEVIGQGARVVLTGPAGGGKTALLLALLERFSEDAISGGGRTLAFYLPLSYLTPAEFDPEPDLLGRMTAHLARLTPGLSPDRIRACLERALAEDRALLLLDGLDALAPADVPAVRDVLERLRRAYRDANILLTCRTEAWSPDLLPDLPVYELLPLSERQQAALVHARLGERVAAADALIAGLRSGLAPTLAERASCPFDLTLLADVHADGGCASGGTALYDAALAAALRRLADASGEDLTAWDLRRAAEAAALHGLSQPEDLLVEPRLLEIFAEARPEPAPGRPGVSPQLALDTLRGDGGLLVGPTVHGTWTFRLQRVQEHLAAARLAEMPSAARRKVVEAQIANRRWRGVWPLLTEMLDDGTPVVSALAASTEGHARQAVPGAVRAARKLDRRWVEDILVNGGELAGPTALHLGRQLDDGERVAVFGAVLEADRLKAEGGERLDARVVLTALDGLDRIHHAGGPLARQAAAAVSAWQAPREVGRRGIETAAVAPGGFLYDDGLATSSIRHFELPGFDLAINPTTVAQWRAFHPRHPMAGAGEPFTDDDHPAVGMSWFEAAVAARWFGGRLPSDAEWDKAAAWSPRAQRRRAYPWGDNWDPSRCNTLETWEGGQGFTTPVDQFRDAGASAWGCRDMAGNVLEWTRSSAPGPGGRRVLRGGSWMASAAFARNGATVWLAPGMRNQAIGFRIAFDPQAE